MWGLRLLGKIDHYKVFGSWLGPALEILLMGMNTPVLRILIIMVIRAFAKLTFLLNADDLNPDEAIRRYVHTAIITSSWLTDSWQVRHHPG